MFRNALTIGFKRASQGIVAVSRSISHSKSCMGYEAEGKTHVDILNNDDEAQLMINGFSQVGFRLNNDVTVLGSMAIFTKSVLSWNVNSMYEINDESLSLFGVLVPKIEILVIGVGDKVEDLSLHKRLFPFSKKSGINLEIMPTEQACAAFNFLNTERRLVAACLIPPQIIKASDDDMVKSKLRYQKLYKLD